MDIIDQCHTIKKSLWQLQIQIDQLHDKLDEIVDGELDRKEKVAEERFKNSATKETNHNELNRIIQEIMQ